MRCSWRLGSSWLVFEHQQQITTYREPGYYLIEFGCGHFISYRYLTYTALGLSIDAADGCWWSDEEFLNPVLDKSA